MLSKSGQFTLYCFEPTKKYYHTFIPSFICGEKIFNDFDGELTCLLKEAHRAFGILDGISRYMPNIDVYLNQIKRSEAYCSCRIDGTDLSLEQFIDNTKQNNISSEITEHCLTALDNSLNNKDFSVQQLCEIRAHVTDDKKGNTFRSIPFFMNEGVVSIVINDEQYNPPPPDYIIELMNDLINYINTSDNTDVFVKSALIHYQLEVIHPFKSGNGRVGRIAAIKHLISSGVLSIPILDLSYYLLKYKTQYFDRIHTVEFIGDYMQWIKFFIKGLIYSAERAIKQLDEWHKLKLSNDEKIKALKRNSANAKLVFRYFEVNLISNIKLTSEAIGLSYNTTAAAINDLCKIGILKQMNNQLRHRKFLYDSFIKVSEIQ